VSDTKPVEDDETPPEHVTDPVEPVEAVEPVDG
jgi:hypothetical protein